MKKLVIMAAAIFATVNIFAQGTVNFSNIGGQSVFNTLTGAAGIAGTTFSVQLYQLVFANPPGDPTSTFTNGDPRVQFPTTDAGFTALGAKVTLAAAGFFVGGNRIAEITPPGAFGYFQVRAWETAFGATYEAAAAANPVGGRTALLGKSNIVRVDTGDPTTVPPGPAGSLVLGGLSRIDLIVVPEPSVIGLGLIGAGALLMLRRRK